MPPPARLSPLELRTLARHTHHTNPTSEPDHAVVKLYVGTTAGWAFTGIQGALALDAAPTEEEKRGNVKLMVVDVFGTGNVVWECEFGKSAEYRVERPFFHVLVMESCIAGISFANPDEAVTLHNTIQKSLLDPPTSSSTSLSSQFKPTHLVPSLFTSKRTSSTSPRTRKALPPTSSPTDLTSNTPTKSHSAATTKKKKRITKSLISGPKNFCHVSHVGYNATSGFDVTNVPKEWLEVFREAGITAEQLKDKKTARFIFEFMQRRSEGQGEEAMEEIGGQGEVRRVSESRAGKKKCAPKAAPPPPPPLLHKTHKTEPVTTALVSRREELRAPPKVPEAPAPPPPIPPPVPPSLPPTPRTLVQGTTMTPPPPAPPLPPPPSASGRTNLSLPQTSPGPISSAPLPPAPPPLPPVGSALIPKSPLSPTSPTPPPPPPPPLPPSHKISSSAPPPPPPPPSLETAPSTAAAPPVAPPPPLPTTTSPPTSVPSSSRAVSGGRADFLSAIRGAGGVSSLRKVSDSDKHGAHSSSGSMGPAATATAAAGAGIAGALAMALQSRQQALHSDEGSSDDDDSWEDDE